MLSPGKANAGIIPAEVFAAGDVGLVSRSGTLTYQIGYELAQLGLGNSTIVGIGGDPVVGSSFIDMLERFEADPETELVVLVGEIGGDEEEKAARYVGRADERSPCSPTSPASRRRRGRRWATPARSSPARSGTAQAKKEALEAAGISVGTTPTEVARARRRALTGEPAARAWRATRLVPMDTISFARGVPAPECLPGEELADCARDGARARRQDDPLLRAGRRLRAAARADRRVATASSRDRCCSRTAALQGFVLLVAAPRAAASACSSRARPTTGR